MVFCPMEEDKNLENQIHIVVYRIRCTINLVVLGVPYLRHKEKQFLRFKRLLPDFVQNFSAKTKYLDCF